MTGKNEPREFSLDDYATAVELWKKVEGVEIAEGDSKDEIAQYLLRNPGLSRVAIAGSIIVGVALCGHDGRRGYIYHLAVDPNFQRRGVGKRLLDEGLDRLRRSGVTRVLVMVAKDNPRGLDFWRSNGWEELESAIAMGIDV